MYSHTNVDAHLSWTQSFKVMRAARMELTARIRQDLSDQVKAKSNGQSGVVLAEEVQQALHRHLVFNQVSSTHFPSLMLHVLTLIRITLL
jgi:hypothetical protein